MSAFPDTPVTLLARMAAQMTGQTDESAWVRLFDLYEPAIRKFSEYHGAGCDGEDVAQEIFLKLVEVLRGGSFKVGGDAGRFRSYLATLIRRELVTRWRKAQVRGGDGNVSMDNPDAGIEPQVDSETAAIIDAKWRLARHAAAFGIPNNSVSQIKTRVEKMIAAIEAEYRD